MVRLGPAVSSKAVASYRTPQRIPQSKIRLLRYETVHRFSAFASLPQRVGAVSATACGGGALLPAAR